jgi:hypothetical protein
LTFEFANTNDGKAILGGVNSIFANPKDVECPFDTCRALSEDCKSPLESGSIRLENAGHVEKQFHQISLDSVEMAAAEAYVSKNSL